MTVDIEETLSRELREVAEGVQVPTLPPVWQEAPRPLRQKRSRPLRSWQPLLAAAAVILVVAGTVAVVATHRDPGTIQPAPQPSESRTSRALTSNPPAVPYLLEGRLYVAGERLPGSWWTMEQAGGTWVAQRDDDTWWWGTDAEPRAIPGKVALLAHLSPHGRLLAVASTHAGGQVLLLDTRSGETVGTLPIDLSDPRDPEALGVVAVTDTAQVFLSDGTEQLMWLRPDSEETVDLRATAPRQWIQRSTAAGMIVLDGDKEDQGDAMYLADISAAGTLTRVRTLPGEDVVVSPSGTWLARGGSWGGESPTDPSIRAQSLDGGQEVALDPPDDRELLASAWEDDDLLIATLFRDGDETGLARCSLRQERCVLIETP